MNSITKIYGLVLISICALVSCTSAKNTSSINTITKTNSKKALEKPYVILISLDGFRWDYVDTYSPPYLSAFIEQGTQATSLIPSFPSKTFPNHYTIATGMYPDKHGLLANTFYNYDKNATYRIRDRDKVVDGSYYSGTPIWVLANNAGMVTASYFFVGSEADIQGIRPTYYYDYNGKVKNEVRANQVIEWLELPDKQRPHLITMYFSDMDDTGHRYGPNNHKELRNTLFELDSVLGNLFKEVERTELPVNIIIVSDHGMLEVPIDKYISTETIKNNDLYITIDNGAIISIHPKEASQINKIYKELQTKEQHFKVYLTADTPHFEYTPKNKNWGPIQILPDEGYYFSSNASIERKRMSGLKVFGHHGFDTNLKEMHGIFYAKGPGLKKRYTNSSIKNIHIYPLICKLLGLEIPKDINGNLESVEGFLKLD